LAWDYTDGLVNLDVDVVGVADSLTSAVMAMVVIFVERIKRPRWAADRVKGRWCTLQYCNMSVRYCNWWRGWRQKPGGLCYTCQCVSHFSFPITHDSTILPSIPHFPLMSHTNPTSASSNFRLIFDNALKAYKKRTKNDLLTHPLAERFEACDSASSMLAVLQEQVQELNQSQCGNTKWLDPTVNVLHAFSETLGEGVGSVCFRK
jgi:hypothetical protein